MSATDFDALKFHEGLVKAGLIVPVGVQGAFGRNHVFESVLEGFNAAVTRLAAADRAEYFVYPPVIDRKVLEKTDYMDSFPHLAGTVHSFFGKELDARKLSERIHAGEPWGAEMGITDVTLNPAACYPVYPSFAGTVPAEGRLVTMLNWVFRNEPSIEPTRMQAFRVREFVRCGTPDQVVQWRDMWLQRGLKLLGELGLPAASDVASDPFFGKGGKMLAASQREQKLKFEVLVPVISKDKPDRVLLVQLPRGPLRRGVRHPDARRQRREHGVPRLRARARRDGAVPDARLRPRRVAGGNATDSLAGVNVLGLDAATYTRHSLHAEDRVWVEKNCYVDVWIEAIHAVGCEPLAILPFCAAIDFEGDQWTFFKPPHDELRELYGLDTQELNCWRPLLAHAEEHLAAGKLISTEADARWLPDTAGTELPAPAYEVDDRDRRPRRLREEAWLFSQRGLLHARR